MESRPSQRAFRLVKLFFPYMRESLHESLWIHLLLAEASAKGICWGTCHWFQKSAIPGSVSYPIMVRICCMASVSLLHFSSLSIPSQGVISPTIAAMRNYCQQTQKHAHSVYLANFGKRIDACKLWQGCQKTRPSARSWANVSFKHLQTIEIRIPASYMHALHSIGRLKQHFKSL